MEDDKTCAATESSCDPRSARRSDLASLLLRTVLGIVFLAHGIQKITAYGWMGGIPSFREWGIPFPELFYPLTIVVEILGGIALVTGLWTRVAAWALLIVMLGALFAVHLRHGFFLPYGIEYVLTLAASLAALALLGPGRWSLRGRRRRNRP